MSPVGRMRSLEEKNKLTRQRLLNTWVGIWMRKRHKNVCKPSWELKTKDQPSKYNALINYGALTTAYKNQQYPPYGYGFYMDGQQQYQSMNYRREDYMTLLVEEAAKLYDKLVKEMVDEIISDYSASTSSPSLQLLSPSDEEEFPAKTWSAHDQPP